MSNVEGLRKELWSTGTFQMILKDVLEYRPEPQTFNPLDKSRDSASQVEDWKAQSAQQRGFDACFKAITGHNIEDLL